MPVKRAGREIGQTVMVFRMSHAFRFWPAIAWPVQFAGFGSIGPRPRQAVLPVTLAVIGLLVGEGNSLIMAFGFLTTVVLTGFGLFHLNQSKAALHRASECTE